MYLHKWMKQIFTLLYFSLLVILVSGFLFFWKKDNNELKNSQLVINQVRTRVSTIMTYLESNPVTYYKENEDIDQLQELCKVQDVELITTDLYGKVLFKTNKEVVVDNLDLKNELHYDLYTARMNQDMFQISFPIIKDNRQIGNAVFQIPYKYVIENKSDWSRWFNFLLFVFASLCLLLLLFILYKQIRRRLLQPIVRLKYHAELIVKGDYDQKSDYVAMDEVGEVYGIFEQMRLELRTSNETKKQQDKIHKELISNISHDLRTPIATLKIYIEAIKGGICTDMSSVIEYAQIMQTHIDKVTRLSDDLFFHLVEELGQLTVKPSEQYSKAVLEEILRPISHYVRKEGVELIEPVDLPDVLISVDAYRLEQVISNLISNALKHTSKGDIIEIKAEIVGSDLKITIRDTGEGILPKDMPFIFNRYFQGEHASGKQKDSSEGAGLGLSICQHIIEAHQGKISFRSVRDQGTVFYFTIPLS